MTSEDFESDGATEDLLEKLIDDAIQASRLKEKELWERWSLSGLFVKVQTLS